MKNENNETRLVSAFNVRWVAAGLLVTGAAFVVCLACTHMVWSSGGSSKAQILISVCLLAVFPFASAFASAIFAWRAVGVRRRMLASISLGLVVGGILLTGFMLSNANRLAAVKAIFVSGDAPASSECEVEE